ncbi:MAG: YcdB/YcdC domain-containing protein, partial [Acidobacteriaceae bacterium]
MHTLIRRGLLPVAAALITSLTILGPLGGLPAAAQTAPGAISLQQAETITRLRTYIPAGFTLSSTSYNAAQTGQPAQYNLNYVKNGAQQDQSFGIGVSVDATTGMILNYYRQPAVNAFHFPASVSAIQAKALAATWVRRLYGTYSKQVAVLRQQPTTGTLTTPIQYTYLFERTVHGVAAPFDGFSLTLSANGHLIQANASWSALAFPTAHPAESMGNAQTIYRNSLHFFLLYGREYSNAVSPTSILAYTQPSTTYPSNWNTPFAGGSIVTTPVIDAATGRVINSNGFADPLPSQSPFKALTPGGPTTFPGATHANWTEEQALIYAERVLHIGKADHFVNDAKNTQPPSTDVIWNFTWNAPDHIQLSASVDATRGVLTNYNEDAQTPGSINFKQPTKITAAQATATAQAFVKRIFPADTGGIAVTLAPFQKFPNGYEHFFELKFLYHGIEVQGTGGFLSVYGDSGQISNFNWQPVSGLTKLPLPKRAVPVAQVVGNWMKAEPLHLQFVLTQPQNDFQAQESHRKLPPPRIVLAYAPVGYYGSGVMVNALTGARQTQGQNQRPYAGPIRDLAGAAHVADVELLVNDGLLGVSPNGDVYPRSVMTRAAFVTLVVNALGLNSPGPLFGDDAVGMRRALSGVSTDAPDYSQLVAAYTRGWIPAGRPVDANAPATRA